MEFENLTCEGYEKCFMEFFTYIEEDHIAVLVNNYKEGKIMVVTTNGDLNHGTDIIGIRSDEPEKVKFMLEHNFIKDDIPRKKERAGYIFINYYELTDETKEEALKQIEENRKKHEEQ